MRKKVLLVVGVVLILAGVAGFVASSVALATVDEVPNVHTPAGIEITLSPEDPRIAERQRQAETVLFGSLLSGVIGVVLLVLAWRTRRP